MRLASDLLFQCPDADHWSAGHRRGFDLHGQQCLSIALLLGVRLGIEHGGDATPGRRIDLRADRTHRQLLSCLGFALAEQRQCLLLLLSAGVRDDDRRTDRLRPALSHHWTSQSMILFA